MRLLDLLFPERRNSAVIAKDRLKIVLAHERASRDAPEFLPALQKELLAVVGRYVAIRDAGRDPLVRARRARAIDGFLVKVEELVENSPGRIRADVVHQRLVAMGFSGTDRSTRRAVAEVKAAWKAGHRRKYRPWVPEPGMWVGVRLG